VAEKSDDASLTTPASPEAIANDPEAEGYQLGASAYIWGYPLVWMERVLRSYSDISAGVPATSYRAPVNRIGWARAPATPSAKDMPTANDDCFYMSAVVVLDCPFLLSVPDAGDSSFAIRVFNMWQELEHYITTGREWTNYVLVPRGWNGEFARWPGWKGPYAPSIPTDATRLDVLTNKVWLWGRLRFASDQPVEAPA
jgi:hypothetical protein